MKIFLTVLLFIPSLSWGNVEKYYCKNTEVFSESTGFERNEKTDLLEDPYVPSFELDYTNKTFIKVGDPTPYTKRGNTYFAKYDNTRFEFYSEDNRLLHILDEIGMLIWWECITEPEYQIFLKQKEPSYKIDQCIDLGFKKGTDGLKNCVLELS